MSVTERTGDGTGDGDLNWLCVFCGSRRGQRPQYQHTAGTFGELLASYGIGLVYGGSSLGVMAAAADGALAAGGKVVGVIPEHLRDREPPRTDLTELVVVDTMHERKTIMFDRADGFVALPGGLGTMEELFEILTWSQLGLHAKPVGLLNVGGYFSKLIGFLDHTVEEGFVAPAHRDLLLHDDDPERLLRRLREFRPPETGGWLDEEDL